MERSVIDINRLVRGRVSQEMLYIDLHGSGREVEVKGRDYVWMNDSESTNQIASHVDLRTPAREVGGV